MQSRQLIKLLQADGWQLERTRGSHHQFVSSDEAGHSNDAASEEGSRERLSAGNSKAGRSEVRF